MIPLGDSIRSRRFPLVNTAIIASCVVVFVLQLTQEGFSDTWVFKPKYLASLAPMLQLGLGGVALRILASMFMHGGYLHIGFNMLFLWIFGDNVEDRMGHLRYLVFYLLCGVAATVAHTLLTAASFVAFPQHQLEIPMLGASGAIAGVLGAYYRLFKGSYVRTLIFPFRFMPLISIRAPIFIGLWFMLQLFFLVFGAAGGGGVAYGAHVGGFIAGYLLCVLFAWMPHGRQPDPRVLDISFND